jgi:hypothetical protein
VDVGSRQDGKYRGGGTLRSTLVLNFIFVFNKKVTDKHDVVDLWPWGGFGHP